MSRRRLVTCKAGECDGALGVETSRVYTWGVVRHRKCTKCGWTLKTTEEIKAPDPARSHQ